MTVKAIVPGLALALLLFCGAQTVFGQETAAGDKDANAGEIGKTSSPAVDPGTTGKRRALSLKALAAKARVDPGDGTVRTLGGIGWLEGCVVDAEKNDIILIGRSAPERPSLTLDDLAVNMRNIWNRADYPCISLDPRPEDIRKINDICAKSGADYAAMKKTLLQIKAAWGPQLTRIIGIPPNSRFAHVLIDADYNMKKLSQGLYAIEGIDSALDFAARDFIHAMETNGQPPFSGVALSRFWFHVSGGEPTFKLAQNLILIDACSIRLLTEKGRAEADGTISFAQTEEPFALAFARQFTEKFHFIAGRDPVYADLENLFRLNALLRAVYFRRDDKQAGLDLSFFLKQYAFQSESKMPPSLPGVSNTKEVKGRVMVDGEAYDYMLSPLIFGGVSLDSPITQSAFQNIDEKDVAELRQVVTASRPDANSLSWELPEPPTK